MRTLTKQQKKLLKEWFLKNYKGGYMFELANEIDLDTYEMIKNIHPTEIHYNNVNHYLQELANEHHYCELCDTLYTKGHSCKPMIDIAKAYD